MTRELTPLALAAGLLATALLIDRQRPVTIPGAGPHVDDGSAAAFVADNEGRARVVGVEEIGDLFRVTVRGLSTAEEVRVVLPRQGKIRPRVGRVVALVVDRRANYEFLRIRVVE